MNIKNIINDILKTDCDWEKTSEESLLSIGLTAEEVLLIILGIAQMYNVNLLSFLLKIETCSIKEFERIMSEESNE